MKRFLLATVISVTLAASAAHAEGTRAAGALNSPTGHAIAASPSKIAPGTTPNVPTATTTTPSKVGPGNLPSVPTATEQHDCPAGQIWWIDHCTTSPVSKPSKPDGTQPSNGPAPLPTGTGLGGQGGGQNETPQPSGPQCAPPQQAKGSYCVWPTGLNGKCPPKTKPLNGFCYSADDYKKAKKE